MTDRAHGLGKPRVELISAEWIEGVGRTLAFGANKHGDDDWARGIKWRLVVGSLLRHSLALLRGQDYDPESGMHNALHVACNSMFLYMYFLKGIGEDDRVKFE
jgi:hypothetical protein